MGLKYYQKLKVKKNKSDFFKIQKYQVILLEILREVFLKIIPYSNHTMVHDSNHVP